MKLTMLFVLMGVYLLACSDEQEIDTATLSEVEVYMTDPEAVARGEALFIGSCAEYCHTLEPEATDASFLFACQWQQNIDDDTIADTIRSGIPETRMVGFGSNFPNGDEDIWKLIAYLRTNQQPCSEP